MDKISHSLNRRQFLAEAAAGLAALGMIPGASLAKQIATGTGKRPNILLIQCDSMDGRVMGCMGDPSAYTPNLDKLAGEGVLFANHYCNSPLCAPSRASMLSGLQLHKCEGWNNNKGLDTEPEGKDKASADVASGGKGKKRKGKDEKKNSNEDMNNSTDLNWKGKNDVTYGFKGLAAKDHNYYMDFEGNGYLLNCFGKNDFQSGGHSIESGISAWTRSSGIRLPIKVRQDFKIVDPKPDPRVVKEKDWQKKDDTIAYLEKYAASDKAKPFFVFCGFNQPHPSYVTSKYWFSKIDQSKIGVPPRDEEPLHPGVEYMKILKGARGDFGRDLIVGVRACYRAMVAELDCLVGEVVNKLEALGLRDNTYIIFTSDHGDMQMEHNLVLKQCLFEPAVRVPLIVTGPGVAKGVVVKDLVSLIDMYPTLMDMAGLETPKALDGRTLMPFLEGGSDGGRPDWVLCQFHGDYSGTGIFMLRQGDWKYVAWAGYEPQLFDMKKDPWEIHNCAREHPDVAKKMDAKLREIVDIDATDAKVKAYDKACFRKWRASVSPKEYRKAMESTYEGFTDEHEQMIEKWLASGK